MMTQVLTVEAAGQVFGVPMDAVVETVRVSRDAIAPVGAARALVLRNRTLPVIDLGQALGRAPSASAGDATVLIVATLPANGVVLKSIAWASGLTSC